MSGSLDNTLKVWDIATGECVATLEGHSQGVRCGAHCTFVMIWLRRRSVALPCFRTGGASFLVMGMIGMRQEWSRCGTWRPANAWRRWKWTTVRRAASSFFCTFMIYLFLIGLGCCRVSRRAARRFCGVGQHAQGLGRGDPQMRGDTDWPLGWRTERGVRIVYFCDLSSM